MIATYSIQALIGEAAESLDAGNFKCSYELYLKALNTAMEELTTLDFVDQQYLVTRPDNLSMIFSLAQSCLRSAEVVTAKASVLLAKLPPAVPPKPVAHRAAPLPPRRPAVMIPVTSASVTQFEDLKNSKDDEDMHRVDDAAEVKTRQAHFAKQRVLRRRSSSPSLSTTTPATPTTPMTTALTAGLASPISAVKSLLSFPVEPAKKSSLWMADDEDEDEEDDDEEGDEAEIDHEGSWLTQGTIDPSCLVPVQTSSGDSIAPAAHPTESVPSIPQAPLVTLYKSLQKRMDDIQLRSPKSREDTRQLADVKFKLNRVRHIHMVATTVPSVLQFPPALVAYQLTLIESHIFRNIPSEALLQHSPKTPHLAIVASTDFFNYLTRMIEHSILLPQEASGRAQHINHWVKVACICNELKNYQTLKAVVSALGTPPIQRLKRSWAFVPKKSLMRLDDLSDLMSEAGNYGRYRERLQQTDKRIVPFLGTFIHDMTYLSALPQPPSRQRVLRVGRPHPPMLKDPRVVELLRTFDGLQQRAPYPAMLSPGCVKHINKNRRRKLSYALNIKKPTYTAPEDETGELTVEIQQCVVTQYLLTRSWVAEKTVDELSQLREPPKAIRSNTSMEPIAASTPTQSNPPVLRGSAGSLSFATSSGDSCDSRPISLDDEVEDEEEKQQEKKAGSFWLFGRKSVDTNAIGLQRSPRQFSFEDLDFQKSSQPSTPLLQLPPPFFRKDFWRHSGIAVTPSERSSLDGDRPGESASSPSLCLSTCSDLAFLQPDNTLPRRRSSSSLKSVAVENRRRMARKTPCPPPQHPLDVSSTDSVAPSLVLSDSPRSFEVPHSFSFTNL